MQGKKMLSTIFREYDIRGKVGSEFIIDQVYQLTQAIAFYFKRHNPHVKTVLVGMDARSHSPAIKDEVIRALQESGMDVLFIGVCPTPVLYFGLYTLPVQAGIMITASHNPPEYNGLKLCLGNHSVWGLQVKEIYALYKEKAHLSAQHQGTVNFYNLIDDYISWLSHHFKHLHNSTISAVIDCSNGTASTVLPQLIDRLGLKNVRLLCVQTDETPKHEADPTKEKNMEDVKQEIRASKPTIGIGLDGDADRMAAMTESGCLIPGDQLLAFFSNDILERHPHASIVMDIKSSSALVDFLASKHAVAHLAPSGHAIIKDYMRTYQALLGGELSCHFFFKDRYFGYDDGIYAALRLLEIVDNKEQSLDVLMQFFPQKVSSPECRIPCDDTQKKEIVDFVLKKFRERADAQLITIDGVRATVPYGWGLIRASNTQPELCLRFESDTPQGLNAVRSDFFTILSAYYDRAFLESACCM